MVCTLKGVLIKQVLAPKMSIQQTKKEKFMKRNVKKLVLALGVGLVLGNSAFAAGRVDYTRYNPKNLAHFDVKIDVEYKASASHAWASLGRFEGTPDQLCMQMVPFLHTPGVRASYVPTDVYSENGNHYIVGYDLYSTRLSCNFTFENINSGATYNNVYNWIAIEGLKDPNPPVLD